MFDCPGFVCLGLVMAPYATVSQRCISKFNIEFRICISAIQNEQHNLRINQILTSLSVTDVVVMTHQELAKKIREASFGEIRERILSSF